jgi:hypothetical protein
VLSILAAIREAAGYPWSVPLKALRPSWMPWIRKRDRMTPHWGFIHYNGRLQVHSSLLGRIPRALYWDTEDPFHYVRL